MSHEPKLQARFEAAWDLVVRGRSAEGAAIAEELTLELPDVVALPLLLSIAKAPVKVGPWVLRALERIGLSPRELGGDLRAFVRDGHLPSETHPDHFAAGGSYDDAGELRRAEDRQHAATAMYAAALARATLHERILFVAHGDRDEPRAVALLREVESLFDRAALVSSMGGALGALAEQGAERILRDHPDAPLGYLLLRDHHAVFDRSTAPRALALGRARSARPAVFCVEAAELARVEGRIDDMRASLREAQRDDPEWPSLDAMIAFGEALIAGRLAIADLVREGAARFESDRLVGLLLDHGLVAQAVDLACVPATDERLRARLSEELGLWASPFPEERDAILAEEEAELANSEKLRAVLRRFEVRAARASERARQGNAACALELLASPAAKGVHAELRLAIAEGRGDVAGVDEARRTYEPRRPRLPDPRRFDEHVTAVYARMGAVAHVRQRVADEASYIEAMPAISISLARRAHVAQWRGWLACADRDEDGAEKAVADFRRLWPLVDVEHTVAKRVAEVQAALARVGGGDEETSRGRAQVSADLARVLRGLVDEDVIALEAESATNLVEDLTTEWIWTPWSTREELAVRLTKRLVESDEVDEVFASDEELRAAIRRLSSR